MSRELRLQTQHVGRQATHRIHHATPDADLRPAIEYTDAVAWLEAHPEIAAEQYAVPERIAGIDPLAKILYGTEPRYLYEDPHGNRDAVPSIDGSNASLDDIRYLLRDPHSPALHPDGMKGWAALNMAWVCGCGSTTNSA
jgi:hypothetical protein